MQVGTISSSQIGKYNRMDPKFHLAVKSVEAEVAALEAQGNKAELAARLEAVSTADLGPILEPLMTGSSSNGFSRRDINTAIERYPYIAYALVVKARDGIRERALERVAQERSYLDGLNVLLPVPIADLSAAGQDTGDGSQPQM